MPRKSDKQPAAKKRTKRTRSSLDASNGGAKLPSKEQLIEFISNATGKVGKREISRAFGIKGGARIALKRILSELADEGILSSARKQIRKRGDLPPVTVIEVIATDSEGDLIAQPSKWDDEDGTKPKIRLLTVSANPRDRERAGNVGIGDSVLANITRLDHPEADGITFEATAIKRLSRERQQLLGIFRTHERGGGTIEPISRKSLRTWHVSRGDAGDAKNGDLVRFSLSRKGRFTQPQAKITTTLGNPDDERQISLIAVHAHAIPDAFPPSVTDACESLPDLTGKNRDDLTDIPFITIDPADARDHDDAVFAQPDTDPANAGGHVVWVAIADVSHYVRPGTALDKEAQKRGNSVYFPDRVVPMLPEIISNNLCSLREGEERPCLAVRMVFDKSGTKRGHKFVRGRMRSHATLAYERAQQLIDATDKATDTSTHIRDTVLKPLWDAYAALGEARKKRSPLDLDLPERKIILDDTGRVKRIATPERLNAHKLIEEFMIQANVAAAQTLEDKKAPLIYRRHDAPSDEKLKAVRDFLESLDLTLAPGGSLKPESFNKILAQTKSLPISDLVNEVVLRAQAQAEYNPENNGHFGLNLAKYTHFTSPIRRYADLIIHRALISALNLGEDGTDKETPPKLNDIATHISEVERRAMAAERETTDRLIALHLAKSVGSTFQAKVAGVTRSGLFVRLNDTGADGFVPASTIGDDYYEHVEEVQALVAQKSGLAYRLGDRVEVKLVEAIPMAGALRFEMLSDPRKLKMPPGMKNRGDGKRQQRRRSGGHPARKANRRRS